MKLRQQNKKMFTRTFTGTHKKNNFEKFVKMITNPA